MGWRTHTVPLGQKACKRLLIDGLNFFAQLGKRTPPHHAQHFVVAPFTFGTERSKLAAHHTMCSFELGKCYGNALDRDAKASGNIAGDERRMGAGVARNEFHQWCVDRVGKRLG